VAGGGGGGRGSRPGSRRQHRHPRGSTREAKEGGCLCLCVCRHVEMLSVRATGTESVPSVRSCGFNAQPPPRPPSLSRAAPPRPSPPMQIHRACHPAGIADCRRRAEMQTPGLHHPTRKPHPAIPPPAPSGSVCWLLSCRRPVASCPCLPLPSNSRTPSTTEPHGGPGRSCAAGTPGAPPRCYGVSLAPRGARSGCQLAQGAERVASDVCGGSAAHQSGLRAINRPAPSYFWNF